MTCHASSIRGSPNKYEFLRGNRQPRRGHLQDVSPLADATQQTNLRCNNVLATSTFCCDNVNYPRCHNVNLSIPRNVVTTYNITFPID